MGNGSSNRAPYFKCWPKDFQADLDYRAMTLAKRGLYHDLLLFQWEHGSLPTDLDRLARAVGVTRREFDAAWGPVSAKFPEGPAGLTNARLERKRADMVKAAERLSARGRKGGQARWNGHATSNAQASAKHPPSNARKCHPDPDPDPDTDELPKKPTCRAKARPRGVGSKVLAVIKHYRIHHPTACPKPTSKTRAVGLISARLSEGFSVGDLQQAIDGMHKTPHNLGQNDRNTKYLGLHIAVRDADQVTRFMEAESNGNGPVLSPNTQATLSAAQSWLLRMKEKDDAEG